jgi:hypothetical protein
MDDGDYVAWQDELRMQQDEALYFAAFHYLERRGSQLADSDARMAIESMSSGERL